MTLLSWLLRLLKLLEQIAFFVDFLISPSGIAITVCLLSYVALLLAGCDAAFAVVLASTVTLALHCGLNHPEF